jgi:hypothetical protein
VDYRAHVLLLGTGAQDHPGRSEARPLLGRSLNVSASGMLVEADEACPIGSELACLVPLGGHTRTLRARVARVASIDEHRVGIGIAFVDLAASDQALLEGIVAGYEVAAEPVAVRFEGVAQPLQSRAVLTEDGVELRTALPFLRLDSQVEVSFTVPGGHVLRQGTLRDVRVERGRHDGAPYLAVSVKLDRGAAHAEPHAQPQAQPDAQPVPEPARPRRTR